MIVATAGHVDHGKTLLVKTLSGVDTDRLSEEKSRGLTIDLGFAYMHRNDEASIGFVDVPGHTKFINNMLAGVSSIDHALLIVAADDGPMPQTIEHLTILSLLGIRELTAVITKVDRVDTTQLTKANQELRQLLVNTGYQNVPTFEVSSITGSGIEALEKYLWQANKKHTARDAAGQFRLAIDRKFTVKGSGLVVTGSIFSGKVRHADDVYLMPQGKKLRVRELHRQNQLNDYAQRGDRCAVNLVGDVDINSINRGNWLASTDKLPFSSRIDVKLTMIGTEKEQLKHWTPVHVHLAAQHVTGRIALLEGKTVRPGEKALAQIVLTTPISACYGDRMVLRNQAANKTLAGGLVLDPFSPARGRAKPARITQLHALQEPEPINRLENLLRVSSNGLDLAALAQSFNVKPEKIKDWLQDHPLDASNIIHHQQHCKRQTELILATLKQSGPGTLSDLRKTLGVSQPLFELLVGQLSAKKAILVDKNQLSLPSQSSALKPAEAALWQKVEPILRDNQRQPPVIFELAKQVNLPATAMEKLLGNCVKLGMVVRPIKNRYFLPEALTEFRQLAIELAGSTPEHQFTVIQYRDATGIGRNLAIELLEYFDGLGFTKRIGDRRIIQDKNR